MLDKRQARYIDLSEIDNVICGRNSVVECQLPKLDVGGSNPLARFFKDSIFQSSSSVESLPDELIRFPAQQRKVELT